MLSFDGRQSGDWIVRYVNGPCDVVNHIRIGKIVHGLFLPMHVPIIRSVMSALHALRG